MYNRTSFLVLFLLVVLGPTAVEVLAADEPVFPTGSFAQLVVYQPNVLAEDSATSPQVSEKATLKPAPSIPTNQPEETFNDRFIALSIALGILGLAFIRRKSKPSQTGISKVESTETTTPSKRVAVTEPVAGYLPTAITTSVDPRTVDMTSKDAAIAEISMGRNIIVPIDFSPNSEFAIRLALVWAKPNDKLTVVYACDLENAFPAENLTPSNLTEIHPAFGAVDSETALHWSRLPWVMVVPFAMEAIQRWALKEFETIKQALPISHNRVSIAFHVLQGDPVTRIVEISEGIRAKLIVLVAHRHSITERWITGSHADTLLHASRIPVIVLCEPIKAELSIPKEILVTTDLSEESLPVLLVLKDLLQGAKPTITILTVETANEHHPKASVILDALAKDFGRLGLKLTNVKIEAADVEAGILDYAKAHTYQLIAMSSHGRLGFAGLIHPSTTKAILHDAGVPILIVHDKAMPIADSVDSLSDFLRLVTG